ncbi:hypothetical protein BFN03_19135 [Rhodococcus sp. WMMA185]|uniref:hypothetical protein n=1 Tax=Rhodococcus sp. WMMA185 TaxID=679318 RepID=UPI00087819FA|nr:hypothetical protein [Rhodococcus sp. WMMA185]AOW94073.1 hypothetical protein BFN03_19135 [Rhodococcus sp. WMMA185]
MPEPIEPMNPIVQPPSSRPRRSLRWAATIGIAIGAIAFVGAFVDLAWWWGAAIAFAVVVLGDKFLPKAFTTRN